MKYHPLLLGIDPGLFGALAFFDDNTGDLTVYDMPLIVLRGKVRKKTGIKNGIVREIDFYELGRIVDFHAEETRKAAIERPNAMPGQGVATMLKMGISIGTARMAVAAHFIPHIAVRPHDWKKYFGLKAGDKNAARRLAAKLLPRHAKLFGLVKDDGRAEAALLALWLKEHPDVAG